jgi:uncharacterized protein (DUF2384 family)
MNANVISRKLENLEHKGSIRAVDVAKMLKIRPETVSRWNVGKAFPRPEAERILLDLDYVVERLADLYEPDEARVWLFSRQKVLDGKIPSELIQRGHADTVIKIIRQIEEGVYV